MNYKNINKQELKDLISSNDDVLLLDIREKYEFDENHIDKAINIPLNTLLFSIDDISEYINKPVVIYCRSGHRSITACNLLELEGFNDLYNLKYGIIE